MQIKRLDHVGIRIADLDTSVSFYKQLGFRLVREDFKEHVFVLKHPVGIELNLLDSAKDNLVNKNVLMDMEERHTGYTHYAIEVLSIGDTQSYLESIDVHITEGPVTFGDGKTSLFIRDPDLNVIEFTQLPNR